MIGSTPPHRRSLSDVTATIREHVVDRKVNNSRTVDATDPLLLASA